MKKKSNNRHKKNCWHKLKNERQEREFQFKVESEKAKINLEQQKIDIEKARVLQNQDNLKIKLILKMQTRRQIVKQKF